MVLVLVMKQLVQDQLLSVGKMIKLFNKKAFTGPDLFLIIILLLAIFLCLYGLIGNSIIDKTEQTCNFGVGFFCWAW